MDVLLTKCDKFGTQWIGVDCQTLTIYSPTCASCSTWHLWQSTGWDPLLYHYMYWLRVACNSNPGTMVPVKRDLCGRTSCFPSLFSCSFSREAHVQECTNPTGVQGGGGCRDRVWCGQLPTPNYHLETQRSRCHPEKRWWDLNSLAVAFSPGPPSPLGFPPLQASETLQSKLRFLCPRITCSSQVLNVCMSVVCIFRHLTFSPKKKTGLQ